MKGIRLFSAALTMTMLLTSSALFAQLKVGSNPTTIGSNSNLETEATNGNKTVIRKDNGNVGVGTATPGNKLEVNQGTAGNSGLRLTQMNSSTPPVTGAQLGINASGDVVVVSGATSKQYITVALTSADQLASANQDIVVDGIVSGNATLPFNPSTGVVTLTVGKTYLITSSVYLRESPLVPNSFAWASYAVVNAATNVKLNNAALGVILTARYGQSQGTTGTISCIYTAAAGANTIKLRMVNVINEASTAGQCLVQVQGFSGFTVVEI